METCELRASVSTDGSEGTESRRKPWPPSDSSHYLHLYTPLSAPCTATLISLSGSLPRLVDQLDEEIEAFSLSECSHKQRDCQLAAAPSGSSLLKRRGVTLTLARP